MVTIRSVEGWLAPFKPGRPKDQWVHRSHSLIELYATSNFRHRIPKSCTINQSSIPKMSQVSRPIIDLHYCMRASAPPLTPAAFNVSRWPRLARWPQFPLLPFDSKKTAEKYYAWNNFDRHFHHRELTGALLHGNFTDPHSSLVMLNRSGRPRKACSTCKGQKVKRKVQCKERTNRLLMNFCRSDALGNGRLAKDAWG